MKINFKHGLVLLIRWGIKNMYIFDDLLEG